MTQTQTTHHATRAAFVAQLANLAAQGYQFDASNVSDDNNCTFQPFVIAYKGADTIYVRFNAMAEATHYKRRTDAFTDAVILIAAGTTDLGQTPDAAPLPVYREFLRYPQNMLMFVAAACKNGAQIAASYRVSSREARVSPVVVLTFAGYAVELAFEDSARDHLYDHPNGALHLAEQIIKKAREIAQ